MNIDRITVDLVLSALKSWQRSELPPRELLELQYAQRDGRTPFERSIDLYHLLCALVVENLQAQRRLSGILHPVQSSADDPLAALRADFRAVSKTRNKTLRAWSALYYRYVAEISPGTTALAEEVGYSSKSFRRYVHRGLQMLAQTLREVEMGTYRGPASVPTCDLPLASRPLYGTASLVREIIALLLDPDGPLFVSLEGIGGSGKTAVARDVARHLAKRDDVTRVLWISLQSEEDGSSQGVASPSWQWQDVISQIARQVGPAELAGLEVRPLLLRLQSLLHTGRVVIVLDYLDAVPDTDILLPLLAQIAGPARYLLTSRQTRSSFPWVHVVNIPELDLAESARLVRHELRAGGRHAPLTEDDMLAIYEVVGGLPLALTLIAHQMRKRPLRAVLEDLCEGRGEAVRNLFNTIYRASWEQLPPSTRILFLSLSGLPEAGRDIGWLRQQTDLPTAEFIAALEQLIDHGFLRVTGSLDVPLYTCHTLTRTFCQTRLVDDWQSEGVS